MNRLYENTIFLQEDYDPPYSLEIISKKYPKLLNCPIHRWRAETGIELIHQEPDEQELDRIWDNWNQMTKDMKKISDKKSIELFGIDNRSNYYLLKSFYKLSFKSPKELLEWMNDIEYGWVSKSGKIHTDFGMKFYNEYSLQSPMEVFKSKTGVCWDQVFFQKYFFDKWKINNRIFYIERKNKNRDTHTFLIYRKNDKFYWFENSFEMVRGIHSSYDYLELINQAYNAMCKHTPGDNGYLVYEVLENPGYSMGCQEFMDFCKSGKLIQYV